MQAGSVLQVTAGYMFKPYIMLLLPQNIQVLQVWGVILLKMKVFCTVPVSLTNWILSNEDLKMI